MPTYLGRIPNTKPRALKPCADLHARAEALGDASPVPPDVTPGDKKRVGAQEILDNVWDGLLGKMGRCSVAQ